MNDDRIPNPLQRSMVRLADTVRTLYVIGARVKHGLSTDQLPDPVFRDYDYVGESDRANSNRNNPLKDHTIYGLYNQKIKPRKRANYEPYL